MVKPLSEYLVAVDECQTAVMPPQADQAFRCTNATRGIYHHDQIGNQHHHRYSYQLLDDIHGCTLLQYK